jgi:Cu2+-exporting ATPase
LIEQHLRSQPGITEVTVAYASQTARVVWDPARAKLSAIRGAVRDIGYDAQPFDPAHRAHLEPEAARRGSARLVFAGAVGMMVMNLAIAAYVKGGPDAAGKLPLWETFARWCQLVGATVLLAYPGQDFFAGAWRDWKRRRVGMDVPIVLGLVVAWVGGAWATARGKGPVYFDAVAMLVFFVLLARAFETRARLRAAAVLDRFAVVRPATASRLDEDGLESTVSALELAPGDVVRVRPGEIVPADGILLEGESGFDEAVLTGEPWPRTRRTGDAILAGSCNRDQPVLLRVTNAGAASTLGEIRRLLERGLASRPPFAELADRLAGPLVAAVLAVSAATAVFWAVRNPSIALPATVAVLMVTCPCALALATPIALAVAAGRFASIGVLPARMAAIERLAIADTVAFDKTGTLTLPALVLEDVNGTGVDRETALSVAAVLEAGSAHPIARAICTAAEQRPHRPLPVGEGISHGSRGITGIVAGVRWWIGSPEFAGVAASRNDERIPVVLTDRDGRVAFFEFAEQLRPGAAGIVTDLRRERIRRAAILSGDARERVDRLAGSLEFDEARGEMAASDKLDWIRSREDAGARLLFVGDGLNDAPTLAAAGTSASFAEAPQLLLLSCDFVLMGNDLGALTLARRIARRSRRLLVQNVTWALAYNVVAVPLAAAGVVPPWAAALGMSASSLIVVANAMRLARPATRSVESVEPVPEVVR